MPSKRTMGESDSDPWRLIATVYCTTEARRLTFASSFNRFRSGMYTVKGQTYLQGKIHEEKIRTGMECEIFVEVRSFLISLLLSSFSL